MSDLPFAKKSLGQHWLTDEMMLQAMCDAATVTSEDTVLEIGPGLGTLTKRLVEQAKHVVAVEFDQKLAQELPGRVTADNLEVVQQDILQFNFNNLPTGYKVAANIPYYLTSNLLRVLSETANPPSVIALLVQKEVAERVAAKPGKMSLLSVSVQLYYQPVLKQVVKAAFFTPPPKVDSQIIQLALREQPLFEQLDTVRFFQVVKAGFASRRKTLLNSLSGGLRLDKATIQEAITASGLSPQMRPQELSLEDWHQLYLTLK